MQRFILVDHSITGLAGHHYEYAVHVLRAAEEAGYKPVLVTNRRFREKGLSWEVLPLFEFGFWPEPRSSRLWKFASKLLTAVSPRWSSLRVRMRYSELGFAWSSRHEWSKYLQRRKGEGAPLALRAAAVAAIVLFQVARLLCVPLLAPFVVIGILLWSIAAVARFGTRIALSLVRGERPVVHRPIRAFFQGLIAAAARFLHPSPMLWSRFGEIRFALSGAPPDLHQQTLAFGRDAERMLRILNPTSSDILFFPTISERDLGGLFEHLDRAERRVDASWHFLFRRNIYTGTRSDYPAQDGRLEDLRLAFERVQTSSLAGRAFFYTDTDELTEQYERLGIARFHTLPVPHTYQLSDRIEHGGPLRLTYLGDARTEKGFALLPDLAASLERPYLETGKIRFALQCNYNIPGGEPKAALALSQLESMPAGYIEFHRRPLTSNQYRELLLASDINLLCYDSVNYYARSSGILVESLAVGIPVIVPSGCWLSRQFLDRFVEYADELKSKMEVLGVRNADQMRWSGEAVQTPREAGSGLLRLGQNSDAYASLDVPLGTTHVLLRGNFGVEGQSAVVSLTEIGWDEEPVRDGRRYFAEAAGGQTRTAVCAELLPDIAKICIRMRALGSAVSWFTTLEIAFLRAPAGRRLPLGAVGLIYHSPQEIPELLKDIIDHYPHYRRTAAEFSREWREYHNSDRLLRDLESVAGLTRESVRKRSACAEDVVV